MARRMTSPVLVGRKQELDRLEELMVAAASGEPGHVIVGGEAGVGKTRLLAALRELAEHSGARVLTGVCVSMGDTGLPYAPYSEILRSLVARDGVAQVRAIVGRPSAELARLVPALGGEALPPGQELWAQTRMYEAFLDLLRTYAQRTPLVVQLEDLHWADAGTLAATSFLFRAIVDEPVFLVATYREDEVVRSHPLRPWLAEASRIERVERMALGPMDEPEVVELATHITGMRPSAELTAELVQRSDGNPFFVEELLCCGTETEQTLPETIREVLLTRVDGVSGTARRLLDVAAVGGRDVSHELLAAVGGHELASDLTLRELVDAGLLMPSSGTRGDGYTFRHALLHEAVHDALLPNERRRLHGAFGEALAAQVGSRRSDASGLVELAHHWREARDPRALDASIRAGDAAMAGFSFDIATGEFEHALGLCETDEAGAERRIELLELVGRAAYLASRFRRAESAIRAAIAALGEAGDRERRTILTVQLGRALWVSGHYQDSLEAYEAAHRLAPEDASVARVRAVSGLGQVYMLNGRYTESVRYCEESASLARSLGLRDLEGHAMNTLGTSLTAIGRIDEGLAAMDESLAIALELDLPDDIGRAYVNRGDILHYAGSSLDALESTRRGIEAIAGMGIDGSYGTYLRHNGVRFAFECGRWEEASELLAQADRNPPEGPGTRLYRAEYALGYLVASGAGEAAGTWEEARRIFRESPPTADAAYPYAAAIELCSLESRFDAAMELVREAIDFVSLADAGRYLADFARVAAWPIAEVGLLARRAGDPAAHGRATDAIGQLTELIASARRTLGDPAGALGEIIRLDREQVLAECARMDGTATAAAWHALAAAWHEAGSPYPALYACWREAEAAELAGDQGAAATTLREAHDDAMQLGARPLAARMESLARKMRLRLGSSRSSGTERAPQVPSPAYGLTPREREVLALVAVGRTNRQVAETLFISESTAGVHVSNIMAKLGVSTRTEAASVALSQGLVQI